MRKTIVFVGVSFFILVSYTLTIAQLSYSPFEGTYQTEDKQSTLKITKIKKTKRQFSLSGSLKGKDFKWVGVGILNGRDFLGITYIEGLNAFDYLLIRHKPGGLIKYKIAKKSDDLHGNENFNDWFRIGD